MTLPGDPKNRWWIEVSGANPKLVSDVRPSLVSLLAFGPQGNPHLEGSGFIISAAKGIAIVLTAKHVLFEGVHRKQRPLPSYAASSLFIPPSATEPSIDPTKMRVVWTGSATAAALKAVHVNCHDSLDAACMVCLPEDFDNESFIPTCIPLDTAIPQVGNVVYLISHDTLKTNDFWRSDDHSGLARFMELENRISIRVGLVTGVHHRGLRHYRWPCFTTSIPAKAGMSGGIVVLPVEGSTIAACGLVSADNSTEDAHNSYHHCGESIITCAWPCLSLSAPDAIPSAPNTPTHTLYDLMRAGRIPTSIGGIDHIDVTNLGDGAFRVDYKNMLDAKLADDPAAK